VHSGRQGLQNLLRPADLLVGLCNWHSLDRCATACRS
jgi:hypothetical protein